MPNNQEILITKLGLIMGSIFSAANMATYDIWSSRILTFVSVVSFVIVIVINFPKFLKIVKKFLK